MSKKKKDVVVAQKILQPASVDRECALNVEQLFIQGFPAIKLEIQSLKNISEEIMLVDVQNADLVLKKFQDVTT